MKLRTTMLGTVLCAVLAVPLTSNATLIGDQIEGSLFNLAGTISGNLGFVTAPFVSPQTVGAGAEFSGSWFFPDFNHVYDISVDVDESAFSVTVTSQSVNPNIGGGDPALAGIRLSDLDWVNMPSGVVTGISLNSAAPGFFGQTFFEDHAVEVWFNSFNAVNGPHVMTFDILTDHPSAVPEPATVLLIGLGLAGLGFARRRRLNV